MIRRPPRSTLFPTRRSSDLKLRMIERAEQALRDLGFRVCRVRHHDALARIEIGRDEMPRALDEERSEEHTSELQSRRDLVCRLLLEKKKDRKDSSWVVLYQV